MNKVVKLMYKIAIVKFIQSDFVKFGHNSKGVIVAVILSILFTIIQILKLRDLQNRGSRSKFEIMKGRSIWEFTTIINLHAVTKQ